MVYSGLGAGQNILQDLRVPCRATPHEAVVVQQARVAKTSEGGRRKGQRLELVVKVGLLALSHVTRLTPPVAACLSTSVRGFGLNMAAFLPRYDEMHRRQTR
jgi:hypothetical protein